MYEDFTSIPLYLTFLLMLIIVFVIMTAKETQYLQINGPKGIPIFGCFFQMDNLLHLTLDRWAYKYGEMFRFSIFGNNILVINSSEIARELYILEPTATFSAGRAHSFPNTYIMRDAGMVLSSYGPEYSYRRKISHQLLRVYGEGLREKEALLLNTLQKMRQEIEKVKNRPVDPSKYIDGFLVETLEMMLSGQRDNEVLQGCLLDMANTFNMILSPVPERILTQFPFIRFFPCRISKTIQKYISQRTKLMDILEETSIKNPDMNGMYQKLQKLVQEDEKREGLKITTTNVAMILHDLVYAGYLTTRGSLKSILKMLISRRDVQKKIQEEVDKVVERDRHPQLTDRKKCPYTQATILETLRYISITPVLPHFTTAEFEFKGIRVPKDCSIIVNSWHIHHCEKEWEDPFTFKPERFLDEDGNLLPASDTKRKRLAIFGFGKRSCIGDVFAKSRLFMFVASIMQQYSVVSPHGDVIQLFHPRDMEPGSVLQPTYYKCTFIPR